MMPAGYARRLMRWLNGSVGGVGGLACRGTRTIVKFDSSQAALHTGRQAQDEFTYRSAEAGDGHDAGNHTWHGVRGTTGSC
jgi:hypothetical protein